MRAILGLQWIEKNADFSSLYHLFDQMREKNFTLSMCQHGTQKQTYSLVIAQLWSIGGNQPLPEPVSRRNSFGQLQGKDRKGLSFMAKVDCCGCARLRCRGMNEVTWQPLQATRWWASWSG